MIFHRAYPEFAGGIAPVSGSTSWTLGAWFNLVARTNANIAICGISFSTTVAIGADTTIQHLIEIALGRQGEEVLKLQIPASTRNDTAVGYYMPVKIFLPEPYLIQVGQKISVRIADSTNSAQTYNGFKILYQTDNNPLIGNSMPNNFQFVGGSSGSFSEKIR